MASELLLPPRKINMNKTPVVFFFTIITIIAAIFIMFQSINRLEKPNPISWGKQTEEMVRLYNTNCAQCHTRSGQGFDSNPDITGTDLSVDG